MLIPWMYSRKAAHLVAPASVYGLMLMASAPPVRQTSASPRAIVWAAVMALWNPEPHNLYAS